MISARIGLQSLLPRARARASAAWVAARSVATEILSDRSHEGNSSRTRVVITVDASNPIAAANSISSITSIRRWPLSTVATNDWWRPSLFATTA